jgi:hypothetical protein
MARPGGGDDLRLAVTDITRPQDGYRGTMASTWQRMIDVPPQKASPVDEQEVDYCINYILTVLQF